MKQDTILRDERYYAVENASYRVGYTILVFGTMILCFARAALFRQTTWDFFGLVIISSLAATVYQIRNKIVPYTYKTLVLIFVLSLVTSATAGLVIYWVKNTFLK